MPINIYPPILESSQPAFLASTSVYNIYFRLQSMTSFDQFEHIQVRIVRQNNNKSIVKTKPAYSGDPIYFPDGTIYLEKSAIQDQIETMQYVEISSSYLAESWQAGALYKIQMRFGREVLWKQTGEKFADWKQRQIQDPQGGAFSEWSTVMVVKAISRPTISILNADNVASTDITSTDRTEPTLTPLFVGAFSIPEVSKEIEDKFKFDLYLGKKERNDEEDLLETSGWIQHNGSISATDQWRFELLLENEQMYTVFYTVETVNGYVTATEPYSFLATRTYLSEITNTWLTVESKERYNRENGCMRLSLRSDDRLNGTYVISRTDETSNYQVWEDLKYITFSAQKFTGETIFTDFTIESGIRYKYAIQQENSAGLRTSPLQDDSNSPHHVDFEYSFLYHDDLQLRLMFNQKMSSFKYTVLTSKQDTLGGKYPHLVKNGYARYAEFPVTGLISFQMDEDRTFFEKGNIFQGKEIIDDEKFDPRMEAQRRLPSGAGMSLDDGHYIDHNLTDDNIFIERKFREKVEEFLNNFDYKLYKSPTEGNITVVLQNVTMTPNATLGRMIFEFSATAYEVAPHDIKSLDEVGIINIGSYKEVELKNTSTSFGQISGLYTTKNNSAEINVYNLIKRKEEVSIGGGYRLQLKEIKSIWIERYPQKESSLDTKYQDNRKIEEQLIKTRDPLAAEIIQLEAELANAKNEGLPTEAIESQIAEYQGIQEAALSQWSSQAIKMQINHSNILVAPGKVYGIEYPITDLRLIGSEYPIIVNYICALEQVEDQTSGVIEAIDAARLWGQTSGVFTDNISLIQENYNYSVIDNVPPYRVYSGQEGIVYDEAGHLIVDRTRFNMYKSLDLYDIIREDARQQIERLYGIVDGFSLTKDNEWQGMTKDGKVILYNFSGITEFKIEAPQGTELLIGKNEDGRKAATVKVGPSGYYSLTPMENLVRYIRLTRPSFAIVNYKCLTSQSKLQLVGSEVQGTYVRVLE